ncbi:MAG TPA: polysaccharide deacetylase family protein [Limnochordia bacterium]
MRGGRVYAVSGRRLMAALALAGVFGAGFWSARIDWVAHPVEMPVATVGQRKFPIFYVQTKEKVGALTFDISWGERSPTAVLDVLRERGQRATFFLSSPWARRHPDVVRRIASEGHEIASHGEAHINMSQYPMETVRENISAAHRVLVELSGQTPRFLRPPNGDYDDMVIDTARSLGYETVIWSVDSLDWKNPGADYLVQRVVEGIFPGAIILFHASDSARQTAEALPAVLDRLAAEGYRLVTLGELLTYGPPVREDPRGRPYKPNQPAL